VSILIKNELLKTNIHDYVSQRKYIHELFVTSISSHAECNREICLPHQRWNVARVQGFFKTLSEWVEFADKSLQAIDCAVLTTKWYIKTQKTLTNKLAIINEKHTKTKPKTSLNSPIRTAHTSAYMISYKCITQYSTELFW